MGVLWPVTFRLALAASCAGMAISPVRAEEPRPPKGGVPAQTVTFPYPHGEETSLNKRILALLSDPAVAGAHWGIAVTDMAGTPLYGLDEGKLFRPASSAKLFVTAAAMAILGPESTVRTAVYGQFNRSTGVVTGDLVLVGGGDPSFGTGDLPYRGSSGTNAPASDAGAHDLSALAEQLGALGVRSVTGDLVGDDTLFRAEGPPEGWAEEDLLWGYGALPSALSFADNELLISVAPLSPATQPGAGGQPGSKVQVDQLVPYLHVANQVRTLALQASSEASAKDSVGWQRSATDPAGFLIYGTISAGRPPIREHIALQDPADYAVQVLRAQLLQRGVQIDGKAHASHRSSAGPEPSKMTSREVDSAAHSLPVLAEHLSPPLAQEIAFTLKTSANLHAEVLLRRLGLGGACAGLGGACAGLGGACAGGVSTRDGARVLRSWLLQAGLLERDFAIFDGSGLSTKDLVTPRAEAQLLAYAAKQPWFAGWKAGLPVGGVDGTLAFRFPTLPLRGHVFAKTGTLGESRALAGYVQGASGREVIFAILDDNHEPGSSADRVAMDRIVEAIAAEN